MRVAGGRVLQRSIHDHNTEKEKESDRKTRNLGKRGDYRDDKRGGEEEAGDERKDGAGDEHGGETPKRPGFAGFHQDDHRYLGIEKRRRRAMAINRGFERPEDCEGSDSSTREGWVSMGVISGSLFR